MARGSIVSTRGSAAQYFGVATTEPRPIQESDGFYDVAAEPSVAILLSPRRVSVESTEALSEMRNSSANSSYDDSDDDDARTRVGESDFDNTSGGEQTAPTTWSMSTSAQPKQPSSPVTSPPVMFIDAAQQSKAMDETKSAGSRTTVAERRFTTAVAIPSPRFVDTVPTAKRSSALLDMLGPNGHRPTSVGVAY